MSNVEQPKTGIARRGFASLDAKRRAAIAAMGGRAAHAKGTAHTFTSAEAVEAGRKSVAARAAKRMKAAS